MTRKANVSSASIKQLSWGAFVRLMAIILSLGLFARMGTPALAKTADGDTVLAFTSDVHNRTDNKSRDRLDGWVDTLSTQVGHFEYMGFCGDMGDATNNAVGHDEFWADAQRVFALMDTKGSEVDAVVYTTGNHEFSPGNFNSTATENRDRYTVDAEGANGSNYRVYCMGCRNNDQTGTGYTVKQNGQDGQVEKLAAYLEACGTDKPIFVMTHFPLHYLSTANRSTKNADKVIQVLNEAAEEGKTIVLLWGHNHSQSDSQYDQFVTKGESITYARGYSATIQFTYCAAGCMSDSEYVGSSSVKGKGIVITVDKDTNDVHLAYYDANGNKLKETTVAATTPPAAKHTITWLDDDGSELYSSEIEAGAVPTYPYATPTKAADAQYTYTFAGWTPDVVAAAADATYTATYTATPISAGGNWERLAGDGRYDTMAAIVSAGFTTSKVAVLATGQDYPDALVAASMAGALECPIILTRPNKLTQQAADELERLGVEEVYVIGGESAVSEAVMSSHDGPSLEGMDIVAHRVSGTTRQGTSIAAMQKIKELGKFNGTVVIATGYGFADTLSIGPWCYKTATPILLTNKSGKLTDKEIEAAKGLGVESV
ncbi:MAG: cell wall-binding repeat-containing protein, partial [Prevotella sp.]